MNPLKNCFGSYLQNPWEISHAAWFKFREDGATRELLGLTTEEDEEEMRVKMDNIKNKGDRSFEASDHTLNREGKKLKASLIKSLKRFQEKTGINEEKYIDEVDDATEMGELHELEAKFRRAGATYYKQQMDRSGLYAHMDPREADFVRKEKQIYFDYIDDPHLPFDAKGEDEPSIIESVINLPKHLEERRKGREKLKSQSSFVKNEYFRQIKHAPVTTDKDALLNKIINQIGKFEKEPSAIQAEFKKATATDKNEKRDTATVLKEIKDKFEKHTGEYNKILADNAELFGGKEVNTPKGNKRQALKEFEDWFADLHSFREMEDMKKKLTDVVLPEREKVYEERDELLNALPEGRRNLLRQKTDEMRLHTLKAYLKESQSKELRESSHALEYIAYLETAEYDGYPVFSDDEKRELKGMIKGSSAELQEAELKVLIGRMIPEREQIVADYLALSPHLRNDLQFFSSNFYKKRSMARESKEKENRELKNPFDIDNLSSLSAAEKTSVLLSKLNSETGKRKAKDIRKGLSQEGKTQRLDTQVKVMNVMTGQWAKNKQVGNTQVEGYMDAIYEGARVNNKRLWRGAFEEGIAKTDNQKYMAETAHTDLSAFLSGRARTWGGRVVQAGRVDAKELAEGRTSMLDKFGRALYPENMLFLDPEGHDDLKPEETGAEILEESVKMELMMMLEAMGVNLNEVPMDFKEALVRLAIVEENAGLFSRLGALNGGQDIVEEAIN